MKSKPVLTMTNSDEASGTTIFDNGAKAFWTEGRSSRIVWLLPNGTWRVEHVGAENDQYDSDDPGPEQRPATIAEEHEHAYARETTEAVNGRFVWLRLVTTDSVK